MDHPIQSPGVELITQEYLAASRELRWRTDLTLAQHVRLTQELAYEHRLRCAKEWRSVLAQIHDDGDLLRTSNIRTS
jgi:hypothetical protein